MLRWPETDEFKAENVDFESAEDKGIYLRRKLEEWIDPLDCDLDCWEDCQKLLFETDKDVRKAYIAELETVI